MIVENKEKSLYKADEISKKIMSLISNELKEFNPSDDPAEQIYICLHTVGILLTKIVTVLVGYGKIYNIKGLNEDIIYKWIGIIAKENIELNK
jgi:hypothetical protein